MGKFDTSDNVIKVILLYIELTKLTFSASAFPHVEQMLLFHFPTDVAVQFVCKLNTSQSPP